MSDGLFGLYEGTVTFRQDPMGLGRIKIEVPGIIEPENSKASPWAFPRGSGGSEKWGKNDVPKIGSDILVQFVNGDINSPVYESAWHGKPINRETNKQESEAFPEFEDPDVLVWGRDWLRLVMDNREGQKIARLKVVKTVNGKEEDIIWLEFNYEDNSAQLYATSALGINADAIIDIDAPTVQVRGRKIVPNNKPIN